MGVDAKRLFGTWRRLRARLLIDQKSAGGRRSKTTEKSPPAAIWSFRMEVARMLAEKCMWLVALKELFHDAVPHTPLPNSFLRTVPVSHLKSKS